MRARAGSRWAEALLHALAGRCVWFRADCRLLEWSAHAHKPRRPPALVRIVTSEPLAKPAEDVPVLRPQLPPGEHIVRYLLRIDASRIYSNHGPLSAELEGRLATHLAMPTGNVVCASSGTAALVGAILAAAGRASEPRTFALVPAFTFVATAVAVELAGYRAWLADIDPETWMLDPDRLMTHPALAQIGLIVPVAPFGRPVPHAPWQRFRERTGIPVVIDGAASLDRIAVEPSRFLGEIPVALSFHATKGFATGEGGGVAVTDATLMRQIVRAMNFGFFGSRNSEAAGINGKMSEYHAAVGLAELDHWPAKQAALRRVIDGYRRGMEQAGLTAGFVGAPEIGLTYVLFHCRGAAEADRVQAGLRERSIDTRLWYGKGLHRQSYFSALPREDLAVTDAIAPCLVGLPMAPDLAEAQIARVVAALEETVAPRD